MEIAGSDSGKPTSQVCRKTPDGIRHESSVFQEQQKRVALIPCALVTYGSSDSTISPVSTCPLLTTIGPAPSNRRNLVK